MQGGSGARGFSTATAVGAHLRRGRALAACEMPARGNRAAATASPDPWPPATWPRRRRALPAPAPTRATTRSWAGRGAPERDMEADTVSALKGAPPPTSTDRPNRWPPPPLCVWGVGWGGWWVVSFVFPISDRHPTPKILIRPPLPTILPVSPAWRCSPPGAAG